MTGTHVRWPPERFYWSVLEAPQWKQTGTIPLGLRPLLEEDLPLAADALQAVGMPCGDGRLLVCAAEVSRIAVLGEGVLTLTPDGLPDFADSSLDPARFNLLVGKSEPLPLRRARIRRHLLAASAVLLTAGLVAVGLQRRAAVWDAAGRDARAGTADLLVRSSAGGSREALSLEVDRLRRLHEAALRIQPPPDAAVALGTILRSWPSAVSSKPQSLSVSETGVTVSVSVMGDATPFLRALIPPAGWKLEEPRVNTADTVTRLTLQLRPSVPSGELR